MTKYPEIITKEVLEQFPDVDNVTIRLDIADTEAELLKMEKEAEAYQILADAQQETSQGKMAAFRRNSRVNGIADRRNFIKFLNAVLKARANSSV